MSTRAFWAPTAAVAGLLAVTVSCQRTNSARNDQTAHTASAANTANTASTANTAKMPDPAQPPAAGAPTDAAAAAASGRVLVQVTDDGFVPSRIVAQAGKPLVLAITRKTAKTCATEIVFKGQPGKTDLPLDKEVEVTYTPQTTGTVPFGCAMGMMIGGALEVR